MHRLTLEIGSERTSAVRTIQKCFVTVGTECTRKHTNIAEYTLKHPVKPGIKKDYLRTDLKWFVEDVGHFILEILRSDKGRSQNKAASATRVNADPV